MYYLIFDVLLRRSAAFSVAFASYLSCILWFSSISHSFMLVLTMSRSRLVAHNSKRTNFKQLIMKKIKRCKTDEFEGIEWGNPLRPEATNLLNMYAAVTDKSREEIEAEVATMR